MPLRLVTAVTLSVIALPALAQGAGYAGSTAGSTASGVPPNPFASNYPSAPPPRAASGRRERRSPHRAAPESGLMPPGRIPR